MSAGRGLDPSMALKVVLKHAAMEVSLTSVPYAARESFSQSRPQVLIRVAGRQPYALEASASFAALTTSRAALRPRQLYLHMRCPVQVGCEHCDFRAIAATSIIFSSNRRCRRQTLWQTRMTIESPTTCRFQRCLPVSRPPMPAACSA